MTGKNGNSGPMVLRASSGESIIIPYTGLDTTIYCLDGDKYCEPLEMGASASSAHYGDRIEFDPDMKDFIRKMIRKAKEPGNKEHSILLPLSDVARETLDKVLEEETSRFMELDGSEILLSNHYPRE
jgi:hypothetical protein